MQGLKRKPTYNELIEQVENSDDIIKKYPDRRASFMRNHPYLTVLDGESYMDALDAQQDAIVKEQQKDLMIRTYSAQTGTSHLENKAVMTSNITHDAETNTKVRKFKDRGTGDGRIIPENVVRHKEIATNTDEPDTVSTRTAATSPNITQRTWRQTQTSPIPLAESFQRTPIQNRYQLFDMAVGDDPIEDAEEDVAQEVDTRQQQQDENLRRAVNLTQGMLRDIQGQSSAASSSGLLPQRLDFTDPMTVNTEGEQRKRNANTPPTSTKKKKKKQSKSDLLEIGDNPEETHEPKGPVGRPKGSAKSSSSGADASSSGATASKGVKKTIEKTKQVGVEKDTHTGKAYWKRQNMEYIYKQLELDGHRFTNLEKIGREDVFDPILGKKVQKKDKGLRKINL